MCILSFDPYNTLHNTKGHPTQNRYNVQLNSSKFHYLSGSEWGSEPYPKSYNQETVEWNVSSGPHGSETVQGKTLGWELLEEVG